MSNPISDGRTADQKIATAISSLMISAAKPIASFFGYLLIQLPRRRDDTIQTMGVEYNFGSMAVNLIYNEEFTCSLAPSELRGVLVHEAIHIMNRHIVRQSYRDRRLWNESCDAAVNYTIEFDLMPGHNDLLTLPKERIYPPPSNIHTSEVYYEMLKKAGEGGQEQTINIYPSLKTGSHDRWDTFTESERQQVDNYVLGAVNLAGQLAGSMPGCAKEAIKDLLEPQVLWSQYLRRFVGANTIISTRDTWTRTHRRYPPIRKNGFLIPTNPGRFFIRSSGVQVVMDTSGSIYYNKRNLEQFYTEIDMIARTHRVFVSEVDTMVHETYKYDRDKFRKTGRTVKGGGGTDMNPGLEEAYANKEIQMVVVLTDGYIFSPPINERKSTLWCLTADGSDSMLKDRRIIKMEH
jgi:predicted metal-dependent peptidase